jgi:hypothetical protein
MALEGFNNRFIQKTDAFVKAKEHLPSNTADFFKQIDNPATHDEQGFPDESLLFERYSSAGYLRWPPDLGVAFQTYKGWRPELYDAFKAGFISTSINKLICNKAAKGKPKKYQRQVNSSTTLPAYMKGMHHFIPEYARIARVVHRRRHDIAPTPSEERIENIEYTMVASGNKNPLRKSTQRKLHYSKNLFSKLLNEKLNEKHWALMAGIVAAGRMEFRIIPPIFEEYKSVYLHVQFDCKKGSSLNSLLSKIAPEGSILQRAGRVDGRLQMNLNGEQAFGFINNLFSNCPILDLIRPEILPMMFGAIGSITPEETLQVYNEIHGPFYKHHIGAPLTETSQIAEPVEV